MNYASYAAINQNVDKKDESCEKLVIAKIGAFVGACLWSVCWCFWSWNSGLDVWQNHIPKL